MPVATAANLVTTCRLALALSLWLVPGDRAWTLVWIATAAAVLDGVDGPLARRRGEATAFGARFDMETDAWLILTLSVLVWRFDKAGAWILVSGLMRYAFVAAAWPWPWLAADLAPSTRRKAACVVQIVTLIVALSPLASWPASAAIAAAGLALLMWSFAADVLWLAGRRR